MDSNLNLNLNWLRTFEAVARCSGFTAASKELGLTQTAVSLHIKGLETKLGHDLFIRRAKSIQLTEIGKAYLPSVRESLQTLTLSTNGLFGPDLESTIIVRSSMALIMWLTPKLKDFQKLHPGVGIKFVTTIWADTVDPQNVDVDIILAPNNHPKSKAEKLSDEFIVPVCSAAAINEIKSVDDLTKANLIHILGFDDHWSRYMAAYGLNHDVRSTRLLVDTSVTACEMVASNLGCAIVLERFATSAIQSGRPIKIAGDRVPLGQSHFLAERNTSRQMHPASETFKSWLRMQF